MTVSVRCILASSLGNATIYSKFGDFSRRRLHTFLTKPSRELSSDKVTEILRANEFSLPLKNDGCCVELSESNQLPSNSPMEDTRSEAKCLLSKGMLFGVFDGHGGPACAQVLAKRLFDYICAGLLPKDILRQYAQSLEGRGPPMDLLEKYNETFDLLPELNSLYRKSFIKYVRKLLEDDEELVEAKLALEKAILSLDEDISTEALNCEMPEVAAQTMQVAISGSVCCVVYIDGSHLHVANVGDCRAVLGVLTKDDVWKAKPLTYDHNYENKSEVARIRSEHPANEARKVLQYGRLLGSLAPLRAFGDFSYKWSKAVQDKLVKTKLPLELVKYFDLSNYRSGFYLTPPYLTVKPEITHHRLTSEDKFLIIATDGLWDEISSTEAVRFVAAHLRGKIVLDPFRVPKEDMKLKDIHELLLRRKQYFDVKPIDRNGATHLLRNALGCRASFSLADSKNFSRYDRDDITITIIYFDTTFPR
ncbi:hypothetical protein V9T40_003642 [Parthenolecanium corni]|uniref:PPM-type phosphatase domain-containing protein n=1 Tax=Parthenolecanium corni TaxID=536013 RepID=A0AAN9TT30_9HEMI